MKRVLTIVTALLVVAVPAFAQNDYGWTISSSGTDPFVNEGLIPAGPLTLYLWFVCATNDGMSAFEAKFVTPPGVLNFGFTPMNGYLNAGNQTRLLLAVGGCPGSDTGTAIPIVAGSWTVFGSVAGSYCLEPSDEDDTLGTVDCSIDPQVWPITQIGFGAGEPPSCNEELCPTVSVESSSWGNVKSLYR